MSEEKGESETDIPTGGASKQKRPRKASQTILAQSQAWNSFARIIVFGLCLLGLLILIGIAMWVHPEQASVKDLIWAVIAISAYLAGSSEANRKDDK